MRLSTLTLEVQFRQWLEHVEVSRQFNIIRVGEYKKHVRLFSKMNYFQSIEENFFSKELLFSRYFVCLDRRETSTALSFWWVPIGGFHVTASQPSWWTVNKRSLISSLCLSTSICSFHHCYLSPEIGWKPPISIILVLGALSIEKLDWN